MNRSNYFNYIEEKLDTLSYRIKIRGKINLLDLNIYSETFFADLVNHLFSYHLKNLNAVQQNTEGIDLIDDKIKIIAQVSSTCSKRKIESSLSKDILGKYKDYRFIFIAIAGDADKLRKDTFKNPHGVAFRPQTDIYDIKSLLNIVLNSPTDMQRVLYDFLRDELGNDIDIVKVDTNLALIINILSNEDLTVATTKPEVNSFEITKKIEFNNLQSAQPIIDDYMIYYSKVDEKYKEFDSQGSNRSISVLAEIRKQYFIQCSLHNDSFEIFLATINGVIEIVKGSKNYIEIPYDELDMCVSILVVDAFIRCRIFKNPEGYRHVVTR